MPTTTNTVAPVLSPETIASWDRFDSRVRSFAQPLYDVTMQTVGSYLQACTAENFSDDDTDGNTMAADLINSVTHLYYEGSPADLSHFLFDTVGDNHQPEGVFVYSIADIAAGVGPLYYEPLASYLKHYTDRIEEEQEKKDAAS